MKYQDPNFDKIREVWRTVKLGIGLRTQDFVHAIEQAGCPLGFRMKNILSKPVFESSNKEIELNLVRVSANDLGFKDDGRQSNNPNIKRVDIYKRALEFDLQLCPPEVGLQLRLQYDDQPPKEKLWVAMNPINDEYDDGYYHHPNENVFMLCRTFIHQEVYSDFGIPTGEFLDIDEMCIETMPADFSNDWGTDILYSVDDLWVFVLPE